MKKETTHSRQLIGTIISTKMHKTALVLVQSVKIHPKYLKRYTRSKKYQAHDPAEAYLVGDRVVIEACRPISKTKRWRVIKKL